MMKRAVAAAIMAISMSFPAIASDDVARYCGMDVPYDVVLWEDGAVIVRGENQTRCTIEDGALLCEDGAELPFAVDGDQLVLGADHFDTPVVMPRCDPGNGT